MARDCRISHHIVERQAMMFRVACDPVRYGLTLKAIEEASGIPYSTLRSYAGNNGEPAEMPASAIYKLIGVIPDELLSLLLPEGRVILKVPDEIDIEELAGDFQDFLVQKGKFHHPESEAGPALGPTETAKLLTHPAAAKMAVGR